jgi:hypothetical protein
MFSMTWAYLKIILAVTIPVSTFVYAREAQMESDRQRIESIVTKPINLRWSIDHPAEALQTDRAECQYLRHLLRDLDS